MNVVPLGAAIALTLPSVNLVWAVHPDACPVAVATKRTPPSAALTANARLVNVPWASAVAVRFVSGSPLDS